MLVSILHRVTGAGLSIAGLAVLTWWLAAIAGGADSYASFSKAAGHPVGIIILIGLTWAFFQHLFSGIRHLVMDSGAGFELDTNKTWSLVSILGGLALTAVFWAMILWGRG